MTNKKAIQILESLISIDGDVIIVGEYKEALEMAIRSLQQEQPSEDLEEEIEKFLANITPSFKDGSYRIMRCGFRVVAHHFANWQKKQMGEQARKKLAKTDITLADLVAFDEGLKLGRRLERQDMLKDAVEGKVVEFAGVGSQAISIDGIALNEVLKPMGLKDGDKVKIVIVPEKED